MPPRDFLVALFLFPCVDADVGLEKEFDQTGVTSWRVQGPLSLARVAPSRLPHSSLCASNAPVSLRLISQSHRNRPNICTQSLDRIQLQRMLLATTKRLSTSPLRRSAFSMLATSTAPAVAGPNGKPTYHTITALKRWSCDDRDLPAVNAIKAVHVYDFDNTRMLVAMQCRTKADSCSVRKPSSE